MVAHENLHRPRAQDAVEQGARWALLAGAVFAALAAWAADTSNGLAEQGLAPRSGPRGPTLFKVMPPQETGVVTENNYADPVTTKNGYRDPRMWTDRYHVFQVGAVGTGVAIGDYDGDGRPDIFVVSKTESCRLFRNLGGWRFEDVTERAGVGDKGEAALIWKQGATFVDV
ncbi:MAG TPA: VCBS repeat-containing protein, partial [Opitutaceae bacterium]|nr:VCBS repeat-containing protein [Opitutaceae bacterium]